MDRPTASVTSIAGVLALPLVVAIGAVIAVSLHRTGHTQGDDFALYLRQARSLFDGDVGQVVPCAQDADHCLRCVCRNGTVGRCSTRDSVPELREPQWTGE